MSARIAVYVYGTDLVSQAGVAAQLRGRPETYVVDERAIDDAAVAVVIVETVDDQLTRIVRGIQRDGCPRVVLVATDYGDDELRLAVAAGVVTLIRRHEVTPELLARAVVAAARHTHHLCLPTGPANARTEPTRQPVQRIQPPQTGAAKLSERELQVLGLLADGYDTLQIATRLAYSERTIKGIIHDLTTRLNLRNRSHAVAYALKSGAL